MKSLNFYWKRMYVLPVAIIGLFAIVGVILLLLSRAATPYASIEPEAGTTSGTTKTTDNKASNGSYIQFGTAQTNNGPPAITLPSGFIAISNYKTLDKDYEFSGSSLPTDWSAGIYNYGYGATCYQPSQVSFSAGAANLTAIKQATNSSSTCGNGYAYQSGWISTAGKFSLPTAASRVDFVAKMPAGQGLWSGLWAVNAQGSNPQGEIDVQEMLLGNTRTVYGSLHGWSPVPTWAETQSTALSSDASQAFHDYTVVWQPGMLTWAVDGVAYAQYTKAQATAAGNSWPFDSANSIYLIANLAVSAANEWGGAPNSSTAFPATMQVQSVKVWR